MNSLRVIPIRANSKNLFERPCKLHIHGICTCIIRWHIFTLAYTHNGPCDQTEKNLIVRLWSLIFLFMPVLEFCFWFFPQNLAIFGWKCYVNRTFFCASHLSWSCDSFIGVDAFRELLNLFGAVRGCHAAAAFYTWTIYHFEWRSREISQPNTQRN